MSNVTIYQSKPEGFKSDVALAAAWLVFNDQYLFLQRNAMSKETYCWGVPGGKVEFGEPPVEALKREIFEETKIDLNFCDVIHVTDCFISKPGWNYTYHMFYYAFKEKPTVEISLENNDYKWVKMNEINDLPLVLGSKETYELFR